MRLLAGDIGGTKTNLAVFSREAGLRHPLAEATFASNEYDSLENMALHFLKAVEQDIDEVDRACFGVAGPVIDGHSKITNLPWQVDETDLTEKLNLRSAKLLNDLEATAYSVLSLAPEDLHTLNIGEPNPIGNIAIVAPGTGLGEAFLTWDGGGYRAHASEGGHADFAPTNPLQLGLTRYLQERFDHVSSERVCSGSGVPNIYNYLKESRFAEEPSWLAEKLTVTADPTPVIIETALNDPDSCELCRATLETFVSIIGAKCGNLALTVLSTGGVYLGGGIPRRIVPALQSDVFMQAFLHKGRLSGVLAKMPIHIILNNKTALLGAARYGLEML